MYFRHQTIPGTIRHCFFMTLLLLCMTISSGCSTKSNLYVASGTPKLSNKAQKMLNNSKKRHIYYFLQSEFCKKRGDFLSAITNINKAIASDPNSFFLKNELIRLYIYTNQLSKAIVEIEQQLENTPDNVELLTIFAQIKLSQNKDVETIDIYTKI